MRKLKLLAALLAMMTVIVSSSVSPAMADHWDYYEDPWGECGWVEVWEWSVVFEEWDFEDYEYGCHEDYWDGPYGDWEPDDYRDGPYGDWDSPYHYPLASDSWDHED